MSVLRMSAVLYVCLAFLVPAVAEDRAAIVKQAIDDYNAGLLPPDRDAKYEKMAKKRREFVFFRGTNHLFWRDFTSDHDWKKYIEDSEFSSDKTKTWIQGDLHAYNFGSLDNDEQTVVYDLNDFDESLIADYQFDVWRMVISLVLIGRLNDTASGGKFTPEQLDGFVDAFTESYLMSLKDYEDDDREEEAEFTKDNTTGKLATFLKKVGKLDPEAAREDMLDKWTKMVAGERVFKSKSERDGKLDEPTTEEEVAIRKAMDGYGETLSGRLEYKKKYFKVKDVAQRLLSGTGSLGTPRFYVLIDGPSDDDDDDRVLDVKKQGKPSAYPYLSAAALAAYDASFQNDAQRHAKGYDALSKHTDDHLGWMHLQGVSDRIDGFYSVRERSPYKESYPAWQDPDEDRKRKLELTKKARFTKLARQWGQILAAAHARADNDFAPDQIPYSFEKHVGEVLRGKRDKFKQQVRKIASDYAIQVVSDWESWRATVPGGNE